MFSTDEFVAWSKKVVLFVHNTSHVDDEPYPSLLSEMGGSGFPTVSYLDAGGHLLRQMPFPTRMDHLAGELVKLGAWQALRAEVERGGADAAKQKQLFLIELEMGNRPFAEMRERRDALKLDERERAQTEQALVDLEFTENLRATSRDGLANVGERFLAMFRQQRMPSPAKETPYWQGIFRFAESKGDAVLFAEVLDWLRTNRADDRRLGRYVKQLEQQLENLEARGGGKR